MNTSFEYTSTLEYRLKALKQENSALKSGEIYVRMKDEHRKKYLFL